MIETDDTIRAIDDVIRFLAGVVAKSGATTARRRNRKPMKTAAVALTEKQLESVNLYGECHGNMSEVARRMGISRTTAKQHYDAANKKLGVTAGKLARTKKLSADTLGQSVKMPKKSG